MRLDHDQKPRPGYYWCRNGNWEIIFVYESGLVDARGIVQDSQTSKLFLSCDISGPLEPPDDVKQYRRWAASARTRGNETYWEDSGSRGPQ